jgi:lia operon protein LiaG
MVLVVILAGLILLLSIVLFGAVSGRETVFDKYFGGFGAGGFGSAALQNRVAIDAADVKKLVIDYDGSACDVVFLPTDEKQIIVEEYLNRTMKKNQTAKVEKSGDRLTVTQRYFKKPIFWFGFGYFTGYVKVYLPAEVFASLEELECVAVSGDIELTALEGPSAGRLNKTELSTVSGDIRMGFLESGQISLSTTSGNVEAPELLGEVRANTVSGKVELGAVVGKVAAGTVSGALSIRSLDGEGHLSAVSGDVSVRSAKLTGDLNAETTSGDVEIGLVADGSFRFVGGTVSGSIDTATAYDGWIRYGKSGKSAEGDVGENPQYQVKINTVSGNIKVK